MLQRCARDRPSQSMAGPPSSANRALLTYSPTTQSDRTVSIETRPRNGNARGRSFEIRTGWLPLGTAHLEPGVSYRSRGFRSPTDEDIHHTIHTTGLTPLAHPCWPRSEDRKAASRVSTTFRSSLPPHRIPRPSGAQSRRLRP